MCKGLALSPGLLIGERGKEGLVSSACTCAVIMQILNNPITYGYYLVYLPFDLNSSHSMYLGITGWSQFENFEQDFEITRETLPCRFTKAYEQRGRPFSASTSVNVRRSFCIL